MARLSRFVIPGQPQHVILRGNNRAEIFCADADYRFFLEKLQLACDKHGCSIHAYILMTNHVHLLMTPQQEQSLTPLMPRLSATRFGHALITGVMTMNHLLCLCSVFFLALCVSLTACASGRAHENLAKWMQDQVGKSTDDPNAYRNRYRELRVEVQELPNGHVEEKYRAGRSQCRVYFEIDRVSQRIVGWRYEPGTEQDCVLVP